MTVLLGKKAYHMFETPFDEIIEWPDLATVCMAGEHEIDTGFPGGGPTIRPVVE